MSRAKASLFSHLQLSDFEGSLTLTRKLRFHIFNFQSLRDFGGVLARKLRLYIFNLTGFEGRLARKLRFHVFNFQFLDGGLARHAFFRDSGHTRCSLFCVLQLDIANRIIPIGVDASRLRK